MTAEQTVVIGLDAADWAFLDAMLDELPHFSQIIDNGVKADLESTLPYMTCPAWACSLTGKNPGKLGVFNINHTYDGMNTLSTREYIDEPFIWEAMSDAGIENWWINVPYTYPPPADVNGGMVTGMATPELEQGTVPDELADRIRDRFPDYEMEATIDGEDKTADLANAKRQTGYKFDLAAEQLADGAEFVMLVVRETDALGHKWWEDTATMAELYRYIDERLGDLMADDRNIVLYSDHGFGPHNYNFHVNTWLEQEGYLVREQDESATTVSREQVLRWLKQLGIDNLVRRILPRSVKRTAKSAMDDTNWTVDYGKTRAFRETGPPTSEYIRLNVEGREENGIVPQEDKDELAQAIKEQLLDVRCSITGEPVIEAAYTAEDVYSGEYADRAPDVLFTPKRGYRMAVLMSDTVTSAIDRNGGAHRPVGMFAAAGPDIEHTEELLEARLYDIAPTLLKMYGLPVPDDMDGNPLDILHGTDATAT